MSASRVRALLIALICSGFLVAGSAGFPAAAAAIARGKAQTGSQTQVGAQAQVGAHAHVSGNARAGAKEVAAQAQVAATVDSGPVDQVTVEAQKEKLWQLNKDINKSVNDFYQTFDKYNTVPAYETRCDEVSRRGSHIHTLVCTPRFVDDANQDEVAGIFGGTAFMPPQLLVAARMLGYKKYLEGLVAKTPELRDAESRFNALQASYQAGLDELGKELKTQWVDLY